MKAHLSLLLFVAIPALTLTATAARAASMTVTDTTNPTDSVIFNTASNQFTVEPTGDLTPINGTITRTGVSSFILSFPGSTTQQQTDQTDFVSDAFGSAADTPNPNGSYSVVISGRTRTGTNFALDATVFDSGNNVVVVLNNNMDLLSYLQANGGGTLNFGGTGGSNNGGGNNNNGSGSPGDPPPGTTPEPSTWALLLCSCAGLLYFQRSRFARR